MRRRSWLFGGMAAALLVGPAAAGTPPDTVVMAKQIADIVSLDPAASFELSGGEVIGNLYEKLLAYDPEDAWRIVGGLAESWSLAADGVTYTFTLRQGLRFASGDPITARDAAWSLRRAVILDKGPAVILNQFGFTPQNVALRIRATDDRTLVLVTERPVAPSLFYACLTANVAAIVDRTLAAAHARGDDLGDGWLRGHSAGSGPFTLRRWRPNEGYTLERNPNYRGARPAVRRIVVRHVAEPTTQRLLLEKGDVDYARNLTGDQLAALKGNPDIVEQSGRKGFLLYLGLNQKNPYLARPKVREALKYLVDYEAIAKNLLSSIYAVHQAFLPDGMLGAIDDDPYRFDPARAKALLAAAGLAGGFTIKMAVEGAAPWTDIAQAIQAEFAAAKIRLEIVPADPKQILTSYRARRHDIVMLEWGPDYRDPQSNAQAFAANPDNSAGSTLKTLAWRNAWEIPAMTAETAAAARERDPEKRARMYEALEREHQRASPFIIMFQRVEVAAHRRNVDGFVIGPSYDTDFYAGIVKR